MVILSGLEFTINTLLIINVLSNRIYYLCSDPTFIPFFHSLHSFRGQIYKSPDANDTAAGLDPSALFQPLPCSIEY